MILITGGAGFIGSHATLRLQELGYATAVLDDLSHGDRRAVLAGEFVQGSFGDPDLLDQIFKKYLISAVMHFGAFIDVGESMHEPKKYFKNNVDNTRILLEGMARHGVKKFIFSSTAAVYGEPQSEKITENHPTHPINPYGESKLKAERLLAEFELQEGISSVILRYFNAAGGDPKGRLKNFKQKESNLIPAALHALTSGRQLTVFGDDYPTPDGTCIRDYIHVWDLAEAHILALQALEQGGLSALYNLGNGKGYSVKEVIAAVEKVTNQKLNWKAGPRRPGDPSVLLADSTRAKDHLGWTPQYPALEKIVGDAWQSIPLPK